MKIYASTQQQGEIKMSEPKKPRLAEVLGVEVGEKFTLRDGKEELSGLHVEEDGTIHDRYEASVSGSIYSFLINHPESIIRAPRLTELEIAFFKATGAKWVSRSPCSSALVLWDGKPRLDKEENVYTGNGEGSNAFVVGMIYSADAFPSVHSGDCICVEEAGGDA